MTTLQPRRPQSHRVDGAQSDLERAASPAYPAWPHDVVQRPQQRSVRLRALKIFEEYSRFRTPESWAPGDAVRLAMLARATAYLERETFLICERRGGDSGLARQMQTKVAQYSRQLGLNTSPVDPRLHGSAAEARRRAEDTLAGAQDELGLLAMPGSPPPVRN